MGKDITYDDLLEELCKAANGGLLKIQPGDIPLKEIERKTHVKVETLVRRAERGEIPDGFEIVERRLPTGQIAKCYRKIV